MNNPATQRHNRKLAERREPEERPPSETAPRGSAGFGTSDAVGLGLIQQAGRGDPHGGAAAPKRSTGRTRSSGEADSVTSTRSGGTQGGGGGGTGRKRRRREEVEAAPPPPPPPVSHFILTLSHDAL